MKTFAALALLALSGCIGTCDRTPPPPAPAASASAPVASPVKPEAGPPPVDAAAVVDRGKTLYARYCDFCHG